MLVNVSRYQPSASTDRPQAPEVSCWQAAGGRRLSHGGNKQTDHFHFDIKQAG